MRINGIMSTVKFNITCGKYIDKIFELLDDNTEVDTYSVSDFAYAALDIMGLSPYKGNSDNVKRLIASKLQ